MEWKDALRRAELLIEGGYPTPTKDVLEMAQLILEREKSINSNRSEQEGVGAPSVPKHND